MVVAAAAVEEAVEALVDALAAAVESLSPRLALQEGDVNFDLVYLGDQVRVFCPP